MQDVICPNCEKIVPYNPETEDYRCRYCGWYESASMISSILDLKRENIRLKEEIKAFKHQEEITLKPGDIRYCVYGGGKDHRAAVLKCQLYKINISSIKTTYSFKPLESDHPPHLSYSGEIDLRAFNTKEEAEKNLRKRLAKRRRKDGRVKSLISERDIAAKNREKYLAEQSEDDDFDEFDA